MNKTLKKIALTAICASLALTPLSLSACKKVSGWPTTFSDGTDYKVGVCQIDTHPALDEARNSFINHLNEKLTGINKKASYAVRNATGQSQNIEPILDYYTDKKANLICAIATPMAIAAKKKTSETPILFTAVTDPTDDDSKLVNSYAAPGGNVTGTSDMNPFKLQADLCKMLDKGSTNKIGFIYNTAEKNSKISLDELRKHANSIGMEVVAAGISEIKDLESAFTKCKNSGVGVIFLPTDNLMAANTKSIRKFNKDITRVPIVCGEMGMNKDCGVATYSVDYTRLGKMTADMAYDILVNGKKPADIPVRDLVSEPTFVIHEKNARDIGYEIPQAVKDLSKK